MMKKGWKGCITYSSDETINLGKTFSQYIEKGDVIAMSGDLASGKTTFIKGILKGLNYKYPVTSPTFTLINEYHGKLPIVHIDCYREEDINRWLKIGFNDYINMENIIVIEWADKILNLLPKKSIYVEFEHKGNNKRKICLRK